jgi:hypothetical protein
VILSPNIRNDPFRHLGFEEDEALTLGKAVAVLNAQAKGRRLGIFKPREEKAKKAQDKGRGERFLIEVLGRPVPATNTEDGIRAVQRGKPINPDSVRSYWMTSSGRTWRRFAGLRRSSPGGTLQGNWPGMPTRCTSASVPTSRRAKRDGERRAT